MPRRKHKQNKRKHSNKSKTKNKKVQKSNIPRDNAFNNIMKKLQDSMQLFDVEQTEDDLKDVENAREIVYNDLGINSELDAQQKNSQFGNLLCEHMEQYCMLNNGNIIQEINSKIPLCHSKFGRGALVCIFSKPSHVKEYNFNTNYLKEALPGFSGRKLYNYQIIQNGQFIFVPLDILTILFPAAFDHYAIKRADYAKDMFYYSIACIYVDFPSNTNYIVHEYMNSNDILHKECHTKLENYIRNTDKYSVNQFMKKFPQLNLSHSGSDLDKKAYQSSLLRSLNESRCKTMLSSSKPLSCKEFVINIRDATIPKSIFFEAINNSDDIDECRKTELKHKFQCIYSDKMETLLAQKCKDFLVSQTKVFSYEGQYESQMVCAMMIQSEIYEKLKSIDEQFVKHFISSGKLLAVVEHSLQTVPNRNKILNDFFSWDAFTKKLVGRKCGNCGKQEERFKDIEKFSKCSSCQKIFYCSMRCQKIHWKKKHRIECKNISEQLS